uniref:Uncharacterized protein n=1 Tax=Rhizophora mucronata TaxID=61149 RepID=A0A2P2NQD4_RHIMU
MVMMSHTIEVQYVHFPLDLPSLIVQELTTLDFIVYSIQYSQDFIFIISLVKLAEHATWK